MDEAFAALAAAFKRQFRLELVIEDLVDEKTIKVTDNQGSGDVKYLGTLRSNWLRRHAPKYGFRSIGHDLLPEVAGGAYVYEGDGEPLTPDEAVEEAEDAIQHAIAAVNEDLDAPEHFVVVSEEEDTEYNAPNVARTPPETFRERFLN